MVGHSRISQAPRIVKQEESHPANQELEVAKYLTIFVIVFAVVLAATVMNAAPPEPPEAPEAPGVPPESLPPVPDEADEMPEAPPTKDKKFIEIRIEGDDIRGIDEFGEEVIFDQSGSRDRDTRREELRRPSDSDPALIQFGTIYIEYDEEIDGDVFALKGDVNVDGAVYGDIFSNGTVKLGPEALVTGNIIAKRLDKHPEAMFEGDYEVFKMDLMPFPVPTSGGLPGLFSWILVTIYVAAFTLLFLLIFRKPVQRIRLHLESGFWKNLFVGLLIVLAILPVFVLLCITIIGIPIALIVFPLLIVAAQVLGFIGFSVFIGRAIGAQISSLRFDSIYMTSLVGVLGSMLPLIISGFFSSVGASWLTTLFFVIGVVLLAVILLAGYGAIWFSRFGLRPREFEIDVDSGSVHTEGGSGTAASPETV